jgi:membrane-anchored protein YejM (alkaline phosphatase superfamily)
VDSPTPPLRAPRARAAYELWLLNVLVGVVLGAGYLRHLPEDGGPLLWVWATAALLSTVAMLTLVPGGLFLFAARSRLAPSALALFQGLGWATFHAVVYADQRIYHVWRYHFNGHVFNVIFARGSEDAIFLGWSVWVSVVLGLAATCALELWLWRRLLERAERTHRRAPALLRPALMGSVLLGAAFLVDKGIYAQADLSRDRELTALARLYPLYPRIPIRDLASSVFGEEHEAQPLVELEGVELDYPHARPELPADGPRHSFLIVGIDCWRRDMLDREVTPNLWDFRTRARSFENHLAGGNSTRFGLFAMLYGLHGTYWFPVLAERRSPVLVDTLLEEGYDARVFSSASMNYPELRDTAWVDIPERVADDFPSEEAWERDELAATACADWLAERDTDEPFFGFLMLDAPHQRYSFPPGAEPFQPCADDVDYMRMSDPAGVEPAELEAVRNRYRNAVHHADRVVGELLDRLDELGLAEDTLVIVTGDHGEEFLEHGLFGHTSSFSPAQVKVPLLAAGPGIEPGVEARPTSHLDVPATLLEGLGADPELRGAWTLGGNLLEPTEERRRIVAGWNELGMWTPDGIVRLTLRWRAFDVELYDYDWRQIVDGRADRVLEDERRVLEQLAAECNRFLR